MSGSEHRPEGVPSGVGAYSRTRGDHAGSMARELLDYQESNPSLYFNIMNAAQHDTQRAILAALARERGGATYDLVRRYVSVSDRSMRKHIKNLEQDGIVERATGRTGAVKFRNEVAEVLCCHAISCYFNQE